MGYASWAIGLAFVLSMWATSPVRAGEGGCGAFEDERRTSHRQIAWADFRGPRPDRYRTFPPLVAEIVTSLGLDALRVGAAQREGGAWLARAEGVCVRAYMHKHRSAHFAEHARIADLAHEQGHFDITLLCANEFAAELSALEARAATREAAEQAVRAQARARYASATARCAQEQERYERETAYGTRRGNQNQWSARLAESVEHGAQELEATLAQAAK